MSIERQDVYTRITDKIIADLEQGVRTWMKSPACILNVSPLHFVFFAWPVTVAYLAAVKSASL